MFWRTLRTKSSWLTAGSGWNLYGNQCNYSRQVVKTHPVNMSKQEGTGYNAVCRAGVCKVIVWSIKFSILSLSAKQKASSYWGSNIPSLNVVVSGTSCTQMRTLYSSCFKFVSLKKWTTKPSLYLVSLFMCSNISES